VSAADDEPPLAAVVSALANEPVGTTWVEHKRASALAFAERVTTRGPLAEPAEIGWQVNRRLHKVGSGALAALMAYRIFVWLLPLVLVLVLGLGLYSDTTESSASEVVDRFGLAGYFASSLASTASTTTGWGRLVGLVLGLFFLLYQTYALLRATSAVHSLAWGLPVKPVRRPLVATVVALALLTAVLLGLGLVRTLPSATDTLLALVFTVLAYAVPGGAWLFVSSQMPHRAADLWALVPGAIVVGIAFAVLHAFNSFLLVPWLGSKQETYGVLGVAAGILFALYLLGWAIAIGAALNRVLDDRRRGVAA
jgi:uncharacterized BrkB/YihY/UPF0761 family membrane protein